VRAFAWGVLLCGCASAPPPAPPPQKPAQIAVAVIEFGDVAGNYGRDGCVKAVVEAGHRAVEDQAIAAALPNDSDIDYQQLGRTLGADLIIDGGLPRGPRSKQMQPPRIVSALKGDVLAASKNKRRVDKSFEIGHETCADLLRQLP